MFVLPHSTTPLTSSTTLAGRHGKTCETEEKRKKRKKNKSPGSLVPTQVQHLKIFLQHLLGDKVKSVRLKTKSRSRGYFTGATPLPSSPTQVKEKGGIYETENRPGVGSTTQVQHL